MMLGNEIGILEGNIHLLLVSFLGGLVLYGLKIAEHFSRKPEDKMPLKKYWFFALALLIVLPLLGSGVTAIYLLNGDKLSTILSFQVGLTSPAIVQSMIISAANNISEQPIEVDDINQ